MGRTTGVLGTESGSGIIDASTSSVIFKAAINSASLPTITTSSVPVGKTFIAQGVCKLVEARDVSGGTKVLSTSTGSSTTYARFQAEGGADSGTSGAADSGTSGGTLWNCSWVPHTCSHYCAHYCARYCAHYCARYCGIGGYGYGFGYGYGYGSARGFSATCTAIAVNGSSSWTQIIPTGFSVVTWLYYEEENN